MKRLAILLTAVALLASAPLSAEAKRFSYILDFGEDVAIVEKDDISLHAQCVQNEGGMGFDYVRLYVVTANNSVMVGANYYPGNGSYVTAVTPADDAMLAYYYTGTGVELVSNNIDNGYALNLTTMHGYVLNVESTILGLNSAGNDCFISVDVKEVKKFKDAL